MDAVFYPAMYEKPEIFMQEGWHYELDNADDDIKYNGVVFNEMKGAFSSPDDVLSRYTFVSLFPDTVYKNESGGDPEVIPTLKYEDFLKYHEEYYHPSNSYIYIYGDMDVNERLEYLDSEYLSDFDVSDVDIHANIERQACLEEIENEFSNFEEWMFASEFNKAKEEQEKISKMVDEISSKIAAFPGLYEKAKNVLPRAINEVRLHIKELQEKDIDLSYLEPEEKLTTIQSALSSSIDQLDAGEFEMAQENLEIIGDHILALQDDVTNEKEAYDEIHVSLQSNLDLVNVIGQELEEIMALYANIKDRFGLEDWTHRFSLAQIQMEDLSNRRDEIQKELKQNQRPSVDVVHGYRKFSEDVNEFHDQVKDMKEMLVGASRDESRAKKQLTKLQLILNEVRLNTVTRHLPSISSQFSAYCCWTNHLQRLTRRCGPSFGHG